MQSDLVLIPYSVLTYSVKGVYSLFPACISSHILPSKPIFLPPLSNLRMTIKRPPVPHLQCRSPRSPP